MERLGPWAVHLLTASGAVFGLLALGAVESGDERLAFLWLGAALIVDGVDGTLARRIRVGERLPNIDGSALDLVIDYLNYVFIPAVIIWRGGYLPGPAGLPLVAAILVSSLYVFARRDMKTDDGYFRGFPALWNVVAFYLFAATPDPWIGAILVLLLVAMTFAPVHVAHPFRVRDYGLALPILAAIWAATTAPLLIEGLSIFVESFLLFMSLATAAAIVGMGLIRTIRGRRAAQ